MILLVAAVCFERLRWRTSVRNVFLEFLLGADNFVLVERRVLQKRTHASLIYAKPRQLEDRVGSGSFENVLDATRKRWNPMDQSSSLNMQTLVRHLVIKCSAKRQIYSIDDCFGYVIFIFSFCLDATAIVSHRFPRVIRRPLTDWVESLLSRDVSMDTVPTNLFRPQYSHRCRRVIYIIFFFAKEKEAYFLQSSGLAAFDRARLRFILLISPWSTHFHGISLKDMSWIDKISCAHQ